MAGPKNLLGIPKRSSGKDLGYQKNQNLKQVGPRQKDFQVTRVKTDGRLGTNTPHSQLKGGLTVDNNQKAGPKGTIGSTAGPHMSVGHVGGDQWSPRVKKSRSMAKPNAKEYANPVNMTRKVLKHVKPD